MEHDFFADQHLTPLPYQRYRDEHGIGLKKFDPSGTEADRFAHITGDTEPMFLAWRLRACHPDVITLEHAGHLCRQDDAAWGTTETEALHAYARMKGLPTP